MSNAIKCSVCGFYYNGATYTNCPFCKKTEEKKVPPIPLGKKTHGTWGIFQKKEKEEQVTSVSEQLAEKNKETQKREETQKKNDVKEVSTATVHTGNPPVLARPMVSELLTTPAKTQEQPGSGEVGGMPLSKQISMSGRTVGKYISNSNGESISPVVGWLVGVKGAYRGQSFNLKSGRNKVGRSHEMDVKLLNDDSVSKASVAVIIFDAKAGQFFIMPGDSDSLCYVNETALYERRALTGYEEIEFGDAGLNKYIFVPFCGERFSWSESDHEEKQ